MTHKYTGSELGLYRAKGMSLEQLFVSLCAYTTPYGSEWMLLHFFPKNIHLDAHGNFHHMVKNPDGTLPSIQFCSHLDSACQYIERVRVMRNDNLITSDGKTILSADCKIGVAIMLKMIEAKIPGWYVFHAGEERGCKGASSLAKDVKTWPIAPKISVEFDRHSYGSIITFQGGNRCCSEVFSKALGDQLVIPGYKPYASDDGGLYTDNGEYVDDIPEVTNISVGYQKHHTHEEQQDIVYAELLLKELLKVDWANLPVVRDPKVSESRYAHLTTWHGAGTWKGRSTDHGRGTWVPGKRDPQGKFGPGHYVYSGPAESEQSKGTQWPTKKDQEEIDRAAKTTSNKATNLLSPARLPAHYKAVTETLGGGFHSVRCVTCDQQNIYTTDELDRPFKFCEYCSAPLDQETEDEAAWKAQYKCDV